MSKERDELAEMRGELAELTAEAAERDDDDWMTEAADAILAAGYRKPRTVTTVEELDALPFESVIMDVHGRVFHMWLLAGWQSAGPTLGTSVALPATVLREGGAA